MEEVLDYESISNANKPIEFTVIVEDEKGRKARAPVQIYTIGLDEFLPIFKKSTYTFQVIKEKYFYIIFT